jgi:hypothetical protein
LDSWDTNHGDLSGKSLRSFKGQFSRPCETETRLIKFKNGFHKAHKGGIEKKKSLGVSAILGDKQETNEIKDQNLN